MTGPSPSNGPLLTLEPLLDSVREGLEAGGWELSGLQKTTSYEFEGRWAGDSSRSAYLFFHRPGVGDWASIDVFLDETSRGLKGNMALVLDGSDLQGIPDPREALARLAALAGGILPAGYRTPLTLRYRLSSPEEDPAEAESEIRFKLLFPGKAIQAGSQAMASLVQSASRAFLSILLAPELQPFLSPSSDPGGAEAR